MSAVTSAVRFERVYRGSGIRRSEDAGAGSGVAPVHWRRVAAIDALDDATVNEYIPASVSDTAKAATLFASDRAHMMTGTVVNSTAGAALD